MRLVAESYARVESATHGDVNDRIQDQLDADVAYFAQHPEQIDQRLAELDREWDTERSLQLNSALLSLAGLGLGLLVNRKWLALPAAVQLFFAQHGIQGWCPPLPMLRRLGVRTVREIEIERNALKALRGDYAGAEQAGDVALRAALRQALPNGSADHGSPSLMPTRMRVRDNTPTAINERIDRETERRVACYADKKGLAAKRLSELDEEWDIERVLEVEGPVTTLTGIFLSAFGKRPAWLAVSFFSQAMLVVHALHGFHPLLGVLRRLRFRTVEEIAAERYALKACQGNFVAVEPAGDGPALTGRGETAVDAAMP